MMVVLGVENYGNSFVRQILRGRTFLGWVEVDPFQHKNRIELSITHFSVLKDLRLEKSVVLKSRVKLWEILPQNLNLGERVPPPCRKRSHVYFTVPTPQK